MHRTANEVAAWLSVALPGERLIYHYGILADDRFSKVTAEKDAPLVYPDLDKLANLVHAEERMGNCHLLIRRVEPGRDYWEYIIQKKVPTRADKERCQNFIDSVLH